MSRFALLHGDVLEHLRTLPSNSADGLLCDPPYGLRFMGKRWDYSVPGVDVWSEALRVLKPGAPARVRRVSYVPPYDGCDRGRGVRDP